MIGPLVGGILVGAYGIQMMIIILSSLFLCYYYEFTYDLPLKRAEQRAPFE